MLPGARRFARQATQSIRVFSRQFHASKGSRYLGLSGVACGLGFAGIPHRCEESRKDGPVEEAAGLRGLYPALEPYKSGFMKTSDGLHSIYYEECGNPNGKPVLFLHGGPAAGFSPMARRFFDPSVYRIVLLDQRGAGKSLPNASLENNTTWHLVGDLEQLRQLLLGGQSWHMVFGGSWGSTLALAYAQSHPTRVQSMVLRGIFLFQQRDMHWLFENGASELFPDRWERFVQIIPSYERSSILNAYYRRLTSDDQATKLEAAKRFVEWEMSISRLRPDFAHIEAQLQKPEYVLPFARAECHYFVHQGWFPSETHLLDNCDKIRHIPTHIVHGRYDIVCRPRMAWDLHKALPLSTVEFTWDSGHSMTEARTIDALVRAADRFRDI